MAGSASPIDFVVLQQAADWFALLRDERVSELDRQAWQRWLDAQPQHRQAWLRVESISGQFERLPQRQAARSALQARGMDRRQALKVLSIIGGGGLGELGPAGDIHDEGLAGALFFFEDAVVAKAFQAGELDAVCHVLLLRVAR